MATTGGEEIEEEEVAVVEEAVQMVLMELEAVKIGSRCL